MTVERNVDGLRDNAQRKRQETFDKVKQGIQKLIKEERVINFNTVADASGVSKAWLYKEPQIKEQIESLRQNHSKSQKVPAKQKTSDASKDAIIKTLKERLKKVEAENRGLREHLEAIHGRQRVLVDENEALRRENEQLTKLLAIAKSDLETIKSGNDKLSLPPSSPVRTKRKVDFSSTQKTANPEIDSEIKSELDRLGIEINSTVKKAIESVPSEATLQAIAVLKEAQSKGKVPNMAGFLVSAIKNSWLPNQDYRKKQELSAFNEWFTLAQSLEMVKYSICDQGVQYVITAEEEWVQFSEMVNRYPLEELQRIKMRQ